MFNYSIHILKRSFFIFWNYAAKKEYKNASIKVYFKCTLCKNKNHASGALPTSLNTNKNKISKNMVINFASLMNVVITILTAWRTVCKEKYCVPWVRIWFGFAYIGLPLSFHPKADFGLQAAWLFISFPTCHWIITHC